VGLPAPTSTEDGYISVDSGCTAEYFGSEMFDLDLGECIGGARRAKDGDEGDLTEPADLRSPIDSSTEAGADIQAARKPRRFT